MSERTYTTADGETLRPGDWFHSVDRFRDQVRSRRVGRGRPFNSTSIPCVGGSSCESDHAFAAEWEAWRFVAQRHRVSIAEAKDRIRKATAQVKRDTKALAELAKSRPYINNASSPAAPREKGAER